MIPVQMSSPGRLWDNARRFSPKLMTWEQVAERMGYELRNVYYLHGRALLEFAVPEEWRG